MEGIECNDISGAMYAYPKINLPKKFIEEAQKQNLTPDTYYCIKMLQNTGNCFVPGSGFGQKESTFHFRTTILPLPDEYFVSVFDKMKKFHRELMKNYK